MEQTLWQTVLENIVFVVQFLLLVAANVWRIRELRKLSRKNRRYGKGVLATRKVVVIGVFSAIAAILMVPEFLVALCAGILRAGFFRASGADRGVRLWTGSGRDDRVLQNTHQAVMKPSSTAFVGELANFAVGCALILPASFFYLAKKNRKHAIIGTVDRDACNDGIRVIFQCGISAAEIF